MMLDCAASVTDAVADAVAERVYWACVRAGVALVVGHDHVDIVPHAWWWALRFHAGVPTISVGDHVIIVCSAYINRTKNTVPRAKNLGRSVGKALGV